MENKEWTFERPKDLPPGPWVTEPDKAQWLDPETGLPCLVRRGGCGAWCGYVGVSANHPYFEKDYDSCDVHVHGGLTFAGHCQHSERGICHVVEEREDDNVWWLGFDCGHFGDACPFWDGRMETIMFYYVGDDSGATYKTYDFVKKETLRLAAQLKALEVRGKGLRSVSPTPENETQDALLIVDETE